MGVLTLILRCHRQVEPTPGHPKKIRVGFSALNLPSFPEMRNLLGDSWTEWLTVVTTVDGNQKSGINWPVEVCSWNLPLFTRFGKHPNGGWHSQFLNHQQYCQTYPTLRILPKFVGWDPSCILSSSEPARDHLNSPVVKPKKSKEQKPRQCHDPKMLSSRTSKGFWIFKVVLGREKCMSHLLEDENVCWWTKSGFTTRDFCERLDH